jgi:Ca-activated chloride channel family protein
MSFAWPLALLLLVLIPLGWLAHRAIGERRARRAGVLALPGHVETGPAARVRTALPATLFILALVAMVVAIARPQGTVALPVGQGIVVLAFDVSDSMSATDQSPTRMDAAKGIASDFVEHQPPGIAIGVVAFSDSGITVQPPSTDQAEVLGAIKQLTPQRGTALGQGLDAALNLIAITEAGSKVDYYTQSSPGPTPAPTPTPAPVPPGSHASAAIVLLTDGENNERPDPLTVAQDAANLGIRVDTVAIGTAAGADLNLDGFHVHSQLDEAMLQQIASTTAGTYFGPDASAQLTDVYSAISPTVTIQNQTIELTALAAGASMALVVLGAMASLAFLGRLP